MSVDFRLQSNLHHRLKERVLKAENSRGKKHRPVYLCEERNIDIDMLNET